MQAQQSLTIGQPLISIPAVSFEEGKRARLRGLYHDFSLLVVRHEVCGQFGRNEERSHLQ